MEEKQIRDCDGRQRLGSSRAEAHQDASGQEAAIGPVEGGPYGTGKVDGVAEDICGSSAVLVGKGDPKEVAHALEERGGREEVGYAGYVAVEPDYVRGVRRVGEEVECGTNNSHSRPGCEEVAPEHGEAD